MTMKRPYLLALAILQLAAVSLTLPAAEAQVSTSAFNTGDTCRNLPVTSVVAQNGAGTIQLCVGTLNTAPSASAGTQVSAYLATPVLSGSGPSLALALTIQDGCTADTPTSFATAANAPAGAQRGTTWPLTMAGDVCRGYIRGTVTSGGSTIFDVPVAFVINAASAFTNQNIVVSGQLDVDGQLDPGPASASIFEWIRHVLEPLAWLAILWFSIWRMTLPGNGPHYLGLMLAAILGFVGAALDMDEFRLSALWLAALGIFLLSLKSRWGTAPTGAEPKP